MNKPFPLIQLVIVLVSLVVLIFIGPQLITKVRGYDVTPTPAQVYDQPGACYSTHVLPPADEVAGVLFTAMKVPEAVTGAFWQVRGENNDVWLKVYFTDIEGDGILFVDLLCGYWPEEDANPGRQQLKWGEFYIERLDDIPA